MNEKPRLPSVGEYVRNYGELIEVQEVTPPPPAKCYDYIFKSLSWRVDALANGKKLRTFVEHNDFFGSDVGLREAINDAQELAVQYAGFIEMIVIQITTHRRMKPTGNENIYDNTYYAFDSYAYSDNVPDPEEKVVWSSKQVKEGK